jgi:hypothetical protein
MDRARERDRLPGKLLPVYRSLGIGRGDILRKPHRGSMARAGKAAPAAPNALMTRRRLADLGLLGNSGSFSFGAMWLLLWLLRPRDRTSQRARDFPAFYTTKPKGMGMGLAICRSMVEAHGGRMWASANEPRGAAFQFTLPLERDESVPAQQVQPNPAA